MCSIEQVSLLDTPCEVCKHCDVLALEVARGQTVLNCCLFLNCRYIPKVREETKEKTREGIHRRRRNGGTDG
jgi:hypothetical protein